MEKKALNQACPGCGTIPVPIGDKMKCPGCGLAMDYQAEWFPAVKGKYVEHLVTYIPLWYEFRNIQEQEMAFSLLLDVPAEEGERASRVLRQQGISFEQERIGDKIMFSFPRPDEWKKATETLKTAGFVTEAVIQEIKTFAAAEHPGSDFFGNIAKEKGDLETPGVGSQENKLRHDGKVFKVPGAEKAMEYVAAWKGPKSTITQWKVSESKVQLYETSKYLKDSQQMFSIVAKEYLPVHAERLRPFCKNVFLYNSFTIFDGVKGGKSALNVIKYIPESVKVEFYKYEPKSLCVICAYPILGESKKYVCPTCKSFYTVDNKIKRVPLGGMYIVTLKEAELEQKPVSLYMAVITGSEEELKDIESKGTAAGLYSEIQGGKLFIKGGKKDLKKFLTDIGLEEVPPEKPPEEMPPEEMPPEEKPPEEKPPEEKPPEGVPELPPPEELPKESIRFISKDKRIEARLYSESELPKDIYAIDKDAGAPDPEALVKEPLKQAIKAAGLKRSGLSESVITSLKCECGFKTSDAALRLAGFTDNKCPKCGRVMTEEGKLYTEPKPFPFGQDIDKDKGEITPEPDQGGVWASKDELDKEKEREERERDKEEEEEEEKEEKKEEKERDREEEEEEEEEKEENLNLKEALSLNPDKISELDLKEVNKLASAMGYRQLTPGQLKKFLLYAVQHEDIKHVNKLMDIPSPLGFMILGYFLGTNRTNR